MFSMRTSNTMFCMRTGGAALAHFLCQQLCSAVTLFGVACERCVGAHVEVAAFRLHVRRVVRQQTETKRFVNRTKRPVMLLMTTKSSP